MEIPLLTKDAIKEALGRTLTERVFDRQAPGERDPVHFDGDRVIDWDRYDLMELFDVPVLLVETSDGYRPDYPTVLSFVEGAR